MPVRSCGPPNLPSSREHASYLCVGRTIGVSEVCGKTMQFKLVDEQPRTYILIFEINDELADGLRAFAVAEKLGGSSFKAIGALSSARLGWFNWASKKYETSAAFDEQLELVSLIGDIAQRDGSPEVHAHAVVARSNGTAYGGHLQRAVVRPTCEVVLTESPGYLSKHIDPESGLALIRV